MCVRENIDVCHNERLNSLNHSACGFYFLVDDLSAEILAPWTAGAYAPIKELLNIPLFVMIS